MACANAGLRAAHRDLEQGGERILQALGVSAHGLSFAQLVVWAMAVGQLWM
jgi:hypothetical protein